MAMQLFAVAFCFRSDVRRTDYENKRDSRRAHDSDKPCIMIDRYCGGIMYYMKKNRLLWLLLLSRAPLFSSTIGPSYLITAVTTNVVSMM